MITRYFEKVLYHGPRWMELVEQGWVTYLVEGEIATMILEIGR